MITATITRDSSGDRFTLSYDNEKGLHSDYVPSWARGLVTYLKSKDIRLLARDSIAELVNRTDQSPLISPLRELRAIESEEDFTAALIESHGQFEVSIEFDDQ